MTTITQDRFAEAKAQFQQLFEQDVQQLNGHAEQPLHQLRQQAIQRLPDLSFPTRRDEDFKYTNFNRALNLSYQQGTNVMIDHATIDAYRLNNMAPIQLVFINGEWNAELSKMENLPEGLTITSIAEALQNDAYKAWIEAQYTKETEGNAAFTALNLAFAKDGVFVHVKKGAVIETSIQLLHLAIVDDQAMVISPQLFVQAETSSQVRFIETYDVAEGHQGAYLSNGIARFALDANAHVSHYRIQNDSKEAFKLTNIDIVQERDSVFKGYTIDLGGRVVRNNLGAEQTGTGADTNMFGVYLGKGDQHIDNQSFMDHASAHCTSNELYKGILTDKARGVFNGKVMVRKDSQKINAFQQNSSLVLSKTAIMDTKPQLEIYADDVRCSHGATIGQLDEDSVFYLRSRGLNDTAARALLQHAFILEVLENVHSEDLQDHIEGLIKAKFAE